MTTAPQELEAPAKRRRVSGDVPEAVAERLHVWAALRLTSAAQIVAELVTKHVPGEDELKSLIGRKGARSDHSEH